MKKQVQGRETNELTVYINKSGLEPETTKEMMELFTPFFDKVMEWKMKADQIVVTSSDQLKEMKQAREARLALKDVRVKVEQERKRMKEDSLKKGKAIDGVANVLKTLIEPIEEDLNKKERFAAIAEEKRLEELKQVRIERLQPFNIQTEFYDLMNMTERAFEQLYENTKRNHQEEIERLRKEEEERLRQAEVIILSKERGEKIKGLTSYYDGEGDLILGELTEENFNELHNSLLTKKADYDAEQARIRLENEVLKKEAEEREKAIEAEKKKRDAEYALEKKKIEEERKLAEEKSKKEREVQEAKIKAERDARQKAEAELKQNQEGEQKRIKAEQERRDADEQVKKKTWANAIRLPDKQKLIALASMIGLIELPEVKSEEAQKIIHNTKELLLKVETYIQEKAGEL